METSLLATKLFLPPSRPGVVKRPCLMSKIDSALGRALLLVSAPAGHGKTTLISDWVRQKQEIRIKGEIDGEWSDLMGGLTVEHADGETVLTHSKRPQYIVIDD